MFLVAVIRYFTYSLLHIFANFEYPQVQVLLSTRQRLIYKQHH
jgi:hypothetical protein